ncbi:MAG: (Fe-S)-binding protein [Anaerolineae bacterium]
MPNYQGSNDALWHSFRVTHVLSCLADPSKNQVIADFSDDISPVFPYINAVLKNVIYNSAANTVTVKQGVRILTFCPRVAVMVKVDGAKDAEAQLEWFRQLCNETWRRHREIEPNHERRKLLGPLDAYLLLPRLNCRRCGEATCMAFALGLLLGERQLWQRPRLREDAYAEGRRRLSELLEGRSREVAIGSDS